MGFAKWQRRLIFKSFNAVCADCGRTWEQGFMLECHHVIPLSEGGGNVISNSRLLCRSCHSKAHIRLGQEALKLGNKRRANQNFWAARTIKKRGMYRYEKGG